MSDPEKFQPVLIWQRGNYRIVKVSKDEFVVEQGNTDAMGQLAWCHHLNIKGTPTMGAVHILWLMLGEAKELF